MEEKYETFYAKIGETNGTLRVTIPTNLCEFAGLKVGDTVKILIRKAN